MSEYMNIAIALNENVIMPAYVMVHSLAVNQNSIPVCIYILYSNLRKEYQNLLVEATQCGSTDNMVQFIEIAPEKTAGLPFNHLWSVEMYYRLMLPELLGDKLERILYLDVDIIVNKDISDLYHTDFEGNLLIAAKDMEFDHIISLNEAESRERNAFFTKLKNEGMTYFCSGVLLMNLKDLRRTYTFDKYMEIFEEIRDKVVLPDQDLLNYTHYKNVKFVDENKYGLFTQTAHENGMTYQEAKENVSILHFTGQAKPWTVNLVRYDIEKIWWEYAKAAPFYYELLEDVFYNIMESTFTEKKFQELAAQNEELKEMLLKFQNIVEQLYKG